MTKQEWNKCFFWLIALFPNWNPGEMTSAAWYGEIGGITQEDFQRAVRHCMSKSAGTFPPGVFEIKNALMPEALPGDVVWQKIWNTSIQLAQLPLPAQQALNALGGYQRLSMLPRTELNFLKKTFTEAYEVYCEKQNSSMLARLEPANSKLIGGTQ